MDRRKKRTSTNQYMMYIDLMEKDSIFATGRLPRDVDGNYLHKKWKELSDRLNTCASGPTLTADEWRKRLNDWKNTTRCKYRRSLSGEKDISMTSLEIKALDLFGKAPNATAETLSIHLKSEKEEPEEEMESQRTSESFQKELQAAVEEAIGGGDDEDDGMGDDVEEHEDVLHSDQMVNHTQAGGAASNNNTQNTAYRTIVVENSFGGEEETTQEQYIPTRRHTLGPNATPSNAATLTASVQAMVSPAPATANVTKLINGDMPLKRLRTSGGPDQIIYEVKKTPLPQTHNQRGSITIHNSMPGSNIGIQQQQQSHHQQTHHHQHAQQHHHTSDHHQHHGNSANSTTTLLAGGINGSSPDGREIARQLKRLADVKTEKLKFEIARFKFNNPGFEYNYPPL